MGELRFDGQVVVVTGAGGGLGRAYALAFAAAGAKVVVNDLGGSTTGEGADSKAADAVVALIQAAGGTAVANYDSVVDGGKIIETAVQTFGKVDVVINNAGILRDVSFHKITDKDWDLLQLVHVKGCYAVTKAAWNLMRKQKFGRIVNVTSAAGLYGNFGQSHYAAAKMGIVGFTNTLAKEGKKRNIHVNVIAPIAASRMTATILPPDMLEALKPEYVVPLVQYLSHSTCEETGSIFEVGAGWISKMRWERSAGKSFPTKGQAFTIDDVAEHFDTICDFTNNVSHPTSADDAFMGPIMANLEQADEEVPQQGGEGKSAAVDVAVALKHQFPATTSVWTEKDVILYAVGIGAAADPLDATELPFVYEGDTNFQTFPTFGVTIPFETMKSVIGMPGLEFNPMMLLHGEQYLEVKQPIPTTASVVNQGKILNIFDKKKGALVVLGVTTRDAKTNQELFYNEYSLFIRGIGGFGGDSGPKLTTGVPPTRAPDVVHREQTLSNATLLYRLSGDSNPLHVDPNMAAMGGFDQPILHGLCSLGYATRAVVKHFCDNDASQFKSVRIRFAKHVFPGETLITEMWRVSNTKIIFQVKVAERGVYVITNGEVTLFGQDAVTAVVADSGPAKAGWHAETLFQDLAQRVNAAIVQKVGATFQYDIKKDGEVRHWFVDLKTGEGSIKEGKGKAECTIAMSDADFNKLMKGKLDPMQAYMKGKLKLSGNMMLAQKLSLLQAPAASM